MSVLRDPAMPSRRTCNYWRATQGHFQGELWRLHGLRAQARAQRCRDRFRHWDASLADRILVRVAHGEALEPMLAGDPALPCRGVLRRWRREQPEYDRALIVAIAVGRRRRGRMNSRCTPALTEAIADRIREGASLASLGRARGMPSRATLYGWVASRRDFAGEVAQACEDREEWYADQILMVTEDAATTTAAQRQVASLIRRHARLQYRPGRKWRRTSDRGMPDR